MSGLPIIVVGAGGHAAVIIEAMRAAGRYDPIVALDPFATHADVLGVPIEQDDRDFARFRQRDVNLAAVAIGDNALRQKLGLQLLAQGLVLPAIVHPTALISPSAVLGAGVVVMAGAHVGARARIDDLAVINTCAIVEHDNQIGASAHVAPGVSLAGSVRIGARTLMGIGSCARQGVQIGADVVVGAGSAVVSDIRDGARVAGCPARAMRR